MARVGLPLNETDGSENASLSLPECCLELFRTDLQETMSSRCLMQCALGRIYTKMALYMLKIQVTCDSPFTQAFDPPIFIVCYKICTMLDYKICKHIKHYA